jgi:hypothetical protein
VHRLVPALVLAARDAALGGAAASPAAWAARLLGRFVPPAAFLPVLLPLARGDGAALGDARARAHGGRTAVAAGALTVLALALQEAPPRRLRAQLPLLLSSGGGAAAPAAAASGDDDDCTA